MCSEEIQDGSHVGWVGPIKVLGLWALLGHGESVSSQYIWMFHCNSVNVQKVSCPVLNQWVEYPSHFLLWALQSMINVTFHNLLSRCCKSMCLWHPGNSVLFLLCSSSFPGLEKQVHCWNYWYCFLIWCVEWHKFLVSVPVVAMQLSPTHCVVHDAMLKSDSSWGHGSEENRCTGREIISCNIKCSPLLYQLSFIIISPASQILFFQLPAANPQTVLFLSCGEEFACFTHLPWLWFS